MARSELDAYFGPDPELLGIMAAAQNSTAYAALAEDEQIALRDRVAQATSFGDLTAADQETLTACVRAFQGGSSHTIQDAAMFGGDWTSEDEARDRLDLPAGRPVPLDVVSGATGFDDVEDDGGMDAKGFDGWVGL